VAIVLIQALRACHYLLVFDVDVYISVFETYIWRIKTTMLYSSFVILLPQKI